MSTRTTIHISIYSLNNKSTIDQPTYKVSAKTDVQLGPEHFVSMSSLQMAISEHARVGFMRSQFFRISIPNIFPDEFISKTETLREYMGDGNTIPAPLQDLIVVRYTKAQCNQLRTKVTWEELCFLDNTVRLKRKYTRVSTITASSVASACDSSPAGAQQLGDTISVFRGSKHAIGQNASDLLEAYDRLMPDQQAQLLGCAATVIDATTERPQAFDDALVDLKRVCGTQYFRPYQFPVIERAAALYKAGAIPISSILKVMAGNRNLHDKVGNVACKRRYGVPTVSIEVPIDLVDDVNALIGTKMLRRNLCSKNKTSVSSSL